MRGSFEKLTRDDDGVARIHIAIQAPSASHAYATAPQSTSIRARFVVGADGAKSEVARQSIKGAERTKYVFAYHEIVRAPTQQADYDADRCDVYYRGALSPDFYGWVFPHGDTMSIGTGSADKGFSLRGAVGRLR